MPLPTLGRSCREYQRSDLPFWDGCCCNNSRHVRLAFVMAKHRAQAHVSRLAKSQHGMVDGVGASGRQMCGNRTVDCAITSALDHLSVGAIVMPRLDTADKLLDGIFLGNRVESCRCFFAYKSNLL